MSKISFIIPVYNCAQYLGECVEQLFNMDFQNFEVILIDDGSIDNSGIICEQLTREHEMVKCIHQCNQGVSTARNNGLAIASGEYVMFLDADDSVEYEKLFAVLRYIEERPDIDMAVFGMSFDYYYKGKKYRRDDLRSPLKGEFECKSWIHNIVELYDCNALSPIWNKIIKKSILENHQLRLNEDMFLYEDLEFSLRCMAQCESIYFSPEVIYHYRQTEDEGNAGRRLKKIEHLPLLLNQIEAALKHLFDLKTRNDNVSSIKTILLKLYLVLAREKIAVSNMKDMIIICEDFAAWINDKQINVPKDNKEFFENLMNKQITTISIHKIYIRFRHKMAVFLKSKGLI